MLDPIGTRPMDFVHFDRSDASVVKSIKQRDLLYTWLRIQNRSGGLPQIEDFQPARFEDELPELMFYDVVRESQTPRFLVVKEGARLVSSFGFSGKGKFLEDMIDSKLWVFTKPIYLECVERRMPVYSAFTVHDLEGRPVLYERLLLPFGNEGGVGQMIASLKSICWDGGFENRDLMRPQGNSPVYIIRSIIEAITPARPPKSAEVADDVVEI
jgi:hypothetical protein